MKARLLSLGRTGSVGRRLHGLLGLAHRAGGARFAEGGTPAPAASEPGPAAPAPEAGSHPIHHHPPHKPHGSRMHLILALATVGVIAAFIVGILVMRSTKPTFKELDAKLTTTAPDGKRVYATLSVADFKNIVKISPMTQDQTGVYFYPSVKEGSAEIVLDPVAWSQDKARILRVNLYR